MRNIFVLLAVVVLVGACAPSQEVLQEAVAGTVGAFTPLPTYTDYPTYTPDPTSTFTPTSPPTRVPTRTLRPTPVRTATPRATATPDFGTRNSPYQLGQVANLVRGGVLNFQLQVVEVIRGADAYSRILSANMFNDAPPAGYEFVLMRIHIAYTGADQGVLSLDKYDMAVVTSGRIITYRDTIIYSPCCIEPDFDFQLLVGGEGEGWLALPVVVDDPNPLLVIGIHDDGTGGIYFSLTP